jgi:hypothetical protein
MQQALPVSAAQFETEAVQTLAELSRQLRLLIAVTPGGARRATDLARVLAVHGKLAWQIYRIAYSDNPVAEAAHIPGRAAMQRFLDAALRRGAPGEQIQAVRSAYQRYERLIGHFAQSRGEFDTMLSALAEHGAEQVDLMHRRAAFRAYSHFLGLQARTHLGCLIYHPSANDPERFDGASIRGMIELRRLRRNAPWVLTQTRASDQDGVIRQPTLREPLDADAEARYGVSLLEEFCTRPPPRIDRITASNGFTTFVVTGDDVGNQSAMTCIVADVFRRAFVRYANAHNRAQASQALIRTPCEVLVQDVLVHESLGWNRPPWLKVLSDHRGVDPADWERDCDRLNISEPVVYLGKGPAVLTTTDVPRYEEIVRYVLSRLRWNAEEFRAYRCRLQYPVVPSSVIIHFDLPEAPPTQ